MRPTSETIIGDAFQRWIQSYRDLPLLINQWANVVRWEMRTRLFLRTAEFLWQEGHTAHADRDEAVAETLKMLEVYRDVRRRRAGDAGDRGREAGERALPRRRQHLFDRGDDAGRQGAAGRHVAFPRHELRRSAEHPVPERSKASSTYCHTTSWGVSTRLIGGVIMTHGDDDGLRLPPTIAPRQIVIVPMLRDKPEDAELLDYCASLEKELKAAGIRALVGL